MRRILPIKHSIDAFSLSYSFCLPLWIQLSPDSEPSARHSGCCRGGPAGAIAIDKGARKGFPFVFVVFNIVYWIMYTLPEDNPGSQG